MDHLPAHPEDGGDVAAAVIRLGQFAAGTDHAALPAAVRDGCS